MIAIDKRQPKDRVTTSTRSFVFYENLVDIVPVIKSFKSPAEIEKHFRDSYECQQYIESLRWKNGLLSPYTGSKNVKHIGFYDTYVCMDTGRSFSALTGTIFSKSKIDLVKWFQVIWLNWQYPEMNSSEMASQLGMNQKTVWGMLKKITLATGSFERKEK